MALSEYDKMLTNSDKLLLAKQRRLVHAYADSLREIRSELANVYAKYSGPDGKLTLAEMSRYKRLSN